MSDILIRGMEMPTEGGAIGIYKISGNFYAARVGKDELFPIVELPEHGDLIDADSLANDLLYDVELAGRALDDTTLVGKEREYLQSEKDIKQNCAYYVKNSPVIVPASEEATNEN